jgi:hypothetical protein
LAVGLFAGDRRANGGEAVSPIHYRLLPEAGRKLRAANLTAAEWRIWSYFSEADPFGDSYKKLPDLLDIMSECGVSKPTFYRAIAKFEEAGLFDFQGEFKFRNLLGFKAAVSNLRIQSQICNSSLNSENPVSNLRIQSQSCNSDIDIERARQTSSDFIQTIPDLLTQEERVSEEIASLRSEPKREQEAIATPPAEKQVPVNSPPVEAKQAARDGFPLGGASQNLKTLPKRDHFADRCNYPGHRYPQLFDFGAGEAWDAESGGWQPCLVDYLTKVWLPDCASNKGKEVTKGKALSWLVERVFDVQGCERIAIAWMESQEWQAKQEREKTQQEQQLEERRAFTPVSASDPERSPEPVEQPSSEMQIGLLRIRYQNALRCRDYTKQQKALKECHQRAQELGVDLQELAIASTPEPEAESPLSPTEINPISLLPQESVDEWSDEEGLPEIPDSVIAFYSDEFESYYSQVGG